MAVINTSRSIRSPSEPRSAVDIDQVEPQPGETKILEPADEARAIREQALSDAAALARENALERAKADTGEPAPQALQGPVRIQAFKYQSIGGTSGSLLVEALRPNGELFKENITIGPNLPAGALAEYLLGLRDRLT